MFPSAGALNVLSFELADQRLCFERLPARAAHHDEQPERADPLDDPVEAEKNCGQCEQ